MSVDLNAQITQALAVTRAERESARAKTGASINFAESGGRVMCRLNGSRSFTGYGDTPAEALLEALHRILTKARKSK